MIDRGGFYPALVQQAVIIAPHPDDELIGCFSLLENKQVSMVVYFDSELARMMEAQKVCAHYGCVMQTLESRLGAFCDMLDDLSSTGRWVFVPTPEGHSLHNWVYYSALLTIPRGRLGVYSVYMTDPFAQGLPQGVARQKKDKLNEFYPSQESLWKYDYKYWLREGLALI